ncbi:MAG: hypothetical protein N2689_17790, partial [Verrucomicrobiae bacterium]|nr:hypothetical protein [Verrucomicrobiae bacterium]
MNLIEAFRDAMRRAGLDHGGVVIADGKLHRFRAGDDHRANSWYVLHADEPAAGAFGCWKRDIKGKWHGRE